jgi:hypothetical protein
MKTHLHRAEALCRAAHGLVGGCLASARRAGRGDNAAAALESCPVLRGASRAFGAGRAVSGNAVAAQGFSPALRGAVLLLSAVVLLALPAVGHAQMGMPDARVMSGIPRAVDDLPAGTVVVLLVNGGLSNVVTDHEVQLEVGTTTRTARTDGTGHATFGDVPAGTPVRAVARIGDERLQSEAFSLPDRGGVRMILAAGGAAASPGVPPVPGTVIFGGQSRVIVELDDDAVQVYYLLDVINGAAGPVTTPKPLEIDMPAGAQDTTVLEGSSPQVVANGPKVTVNGPFAPGATSVQVACTLPVSGPRLGIRQVFPAPLGSVALMVQKAGDVRAESPQARDRRDVQVQGRTYIAATGPALAAGSPLVLELAGLPHRSRAPLAVALLAALAILAGGAAAAFHPGDTAAAARAELEARRERALGQIVRLESQARAGRIDAARFDARRAELMVELERIYGELDTPAPPPAEEGLAR